MSLQNITQEIGQIGQKLNQIAGAPVGSGLNPGLQAQPFFSPDLRRPAQPPLNGMPSVLTQDIMSPSSYIDGVVPDFGPIETTVSSPFSGGSMTGIAGVLQGRLNRMLPNAELQTSFRDGGIASTYPFMEYLQQMQKQGYAVGGLVEGPGTGTSDDIPAIILQNGVPVENALLSDKEFVFTNRAVKGAGNGDYGKGAAKMYEMMKKYEAMA